MKFIYSFFIIIVLTTVISINCKASDNSSSLYQTSTKESFGNVNVITTYDLSTGIITVETSVLDKETGYISKTIETTNTVTGEVYTDTVILPPKNCGYIYVGDSRYKGLDMYTNLSKEPNTWVIAEVSKGYSWLTNTVEKEIDKIIAGNPEITDWYEIYTLGINDPGNIKKYAKWYKNRGQNHNAILVSLNPIERHRSITNELISDFNESLKSTNLPYIDCYEYLMQEGFSTADGVHYNVSTNKRINKYVKSCVKNIASDF